MRLKDKVILVTGGGMGMGRAAALAFAHEGASVVIADVNDEAGNATAQAIQQSGGAAHFVHADVSRAADCEAMVAAALNRFGKLNVCYANAAVQLVGQDARAHELSEEIWDRTMAINLKGAWLTCKYAIAAMLKSGGGSIIIAGSPTGMSGAGAGFTAYSSSKGGVHGLMRVMAADYARDGIRVNALIPGPMKTPLTKDLFADPTVAEALARRVMLGRLGEAEDVTGLLVFLASDESAFCTGGFYMADGGFTAL
ncbi:MAG: SDR family oxidoreductase [Anaerolineae bacterium]|nr:SDR family oxidoreductase [Anaerolineae bacterium]